MIEINLSPVPIAGPGDSELVRRYDAEGMAEEIRLLERKSLGDRVWLAKHMRQMRQMYVDALRKHLSH